MSIIDIRTGSMKLTNRCGSRADFDASKLHFRFGNLNSFTRYDAVSEIRHFRFENLGFRGVVRNFQFSNLTCRPEVTSYRKNGILMPREFKCPVRFNYQRYFYTEYRGENSPLNCRVQCVCFFLTGIATLVNGYFSEESSDVGRCVPERIWTLCIRPDSGVDV